MDMSFFDQPAAAPRVSGQVKNHFMRQSQLLMSEQSIGLLGRQIGLLVKNRNSDIALIGGKNSGKTTFAINLSGVFNQPTLVEASPTNNKKYPIWSVRYEAGVSRIAMVDRSLFDALNLEPANDINTCMISEHVPEPEQTGSDLVIHIRQLSAPLSALFSTARIFTIYSNPESPVAMDVMRSFEGRASAEISPPYISIPDSASDGVAGLPVFSF